jgi:hypothetical protein
MISTEELHRKAAVEGLRFDQAEKDYIILSVLSSLAGIPEIKNRWFFKGGTCLRYCYYAGFRFSEDIDFSCEKTADNVREASRVLTRATETLSERTGLILRCKEPRADEGNRQVEISVEYSRGGPRRKALPAVKAHLSFDEPLLASPEEPMVRPSYAEIHPFSVSAYSKIEIVAEKLRALLQQQDKWPRPRDLYDLWYITCFKGEKFDRARLRTLFENKCRIRGVAAETSQLHSQNLCEWNRKAWANQLLPMIKDGPEYETVWMQWSAVCAELL